MNELIEQTITRNNPHIDPHMSVWGWEIPVYLFLGGLVAGLLILSGIFFLLGKEKQMPFIVRRAPIWAPPILAVGMIALFLDLSHKLYFWRFYTAFISTSPMSWGSWILLVAFPVSILFGLIQLVGEDRRFMEDKLSRVQFAKNLLQSLFRLSDRFKKYARHFAIINIIVGIALGIYTGILLSTFVARPLWNTSLLGFLFLSSGISAACGFGMLFSNNEHEEKSLVKIDLLFLVVEVFILLQIFISLFTSSIFEKNAGFLAIGGPFTAVFFSLVLIGGLLLPIYLEILELKGKVKLKITTAIIVLIGGLLLRIFIVYVGQYSSIS